jgi:phage tail P2-like protein
MAASMARNLLPPNATVLERNAAAVGSALGDLPAPLRDLWNPDTCPLKALPWLAWAVRVDAWDDAWTEAQKRAVIKSAYQVHKQKGTVGSVEAALDALGVSADIVEWWQEQPPATPHTFRIDVDTEYMDLTDSFTASIERQVSAVKPVRSHFTVRFMATSRPVLNIGLAVQDVIITSVYPKP